MAVHWHQIYSSMAFVLVSRDDLRTPASFVTKWGSRTAREWFDLDSPNFTRTLILVGPTTTLDMTSLAASGRLQNAIRYCTKVSRTGAAANKSNKLVTVSPRITQFYTGIHANLVYSPTGYDVTSYFQSAFIEVWKKMVENATTQLWVEFLESGISECREILHICRGQPALQTCQIWCHYLLSISWKMQTSTAQKCVKRVRPA